MQLHIIWDNFLKIAKEEAGSQVVETWFKAVTLHAVNLQSREVILKMPNNFVSNWIQEHYHTLLNIHLKRLLSIDALTIVFSSEPIPLAPATALTSPPTQTFRPAQVTTMPKGELVPTESAQKGQKKNALNEAYTFENFVVGPSNSLAHGAAYAVSQSFMGSVYNPLYIYGGTGLGKTHLLHAIGNAAKATNPNLRIRYETSDNFMHEFIKAIRFDKAHQFRDRYLSLDLLLLDDIQFFSKKEQTQETFFHIFNALHEKKKQIVLSSDVFPEEITGLQQRLISRMEWGLVADMQTPDLETKVAILNKKADSLKISLSDDVSHFIAARIHSNIRQLEGALIRVDAFASLTGQKISLELAQRVLMNFQEPVRGQHLELQDVASTVAKFFHTNVQEIKSKSRSQQIVTVRQTACYFMKKLTTSSLQAIGEFFNGRDHSTIIHAITKIEERLKEDRAFLQKVKTLEQQLLQR